MIERRLQGDPSLQPPRIYAGALVLRPGLPLPPARLVNVLNGLKYEQKTDTATPGQAGEFVAGPSEGVLWPRRSADSADEPVAIVFDGDHVRELRGTSTRKAYATQTLEPELITYLFDQQREKRRIVKYEELPDVLIKAVLGIEDKRFFSHPGLDPFRIVGAALRNLRAESYIQGGSTITQQLVKNFFLTPERTFKRKAQEAVLAFVLERRVQKK